MSVPQPTNGIHSLSDRDYFAIDLPSSSTTKTLIGRPNAALAWERANPKDDDNEAFAIGAFAHAMILAPESISENFIITGKIDRRTKEGKAEADALARRASLSGARIITDEQAALATAMAEAVQNHPVASALLSHAKHREITIITDIVGRPAKGKIDALAHKERTALTPGATIVIDIKTTASADPREFAASAAKFGYFHQAAWYRRLVEAEYGHGGTLVDDYVIIAVEKNAPHLVAVYRVPPVAIEVADRKIDELVARWWMVKEGDASGYPEQLTDLVAPPWWLAAD